MKNVTKFIFISLLLFMAIFLLEHINHRFWLNDFKVYYSAAKAMIHNEQIYGIPFGLESGYYKYSVFTLLLFTPYCLFSYPIASSIHFFIIAFSIIGMIILLSKIFQTYFKFKAPKWGYLLLLAMLFPVLPHFFRDMHLGNVNAILLYLTCIALWLIVKQKNIPAGILLSLVFLCKPYFLLLILPLALHQKIKVILSIGISTVILLLTPAIFLGFSKNIFLIGEWVKAMTHHGTYLSSDHTVSSLVKYYFWSSCPKNIDLYILVFFIFGYILYFFINDRIERKIIKTTKPSNQSLIIQYFWVIAIIPNLVITDTEHFMYVTPFIGLLIFYIYSFRNYISITLLILFIILYSISPPFICGSLGISNILIISMALYFFSNKNLWLKINPKKKDFLVNDDL